MHEQPGKTKAQHHIEEIMSQLDPQSERYRVLSSARRFKSSWIELGEELLKVNRQHLYRDWGYESFEEYCSREVRIKKPTALKLTRAYNYLSREEPQLLTRQSDLAQLPDYRTVELLRQAREEKVVSGEQYAELRRAAVDQQRSHPTVLKQFKEMTASDGDPADDRQRHCKAALQAARRLRGSLEHLGDLGTSYRPVLDELLEMLDQALSEQNSPADGPSSEGA